MRTKQNNSANGNCVTAMAHAFAKIGIKSPRRWGKRWPQRRGCKRVDVSTGQVVMVHA